MYVGDGFQSAMAGISDRALRTRCPRHAWPLTCASKLGPRASFSDDVAFGREIVHELACKYLGKYTVYVLHAPGRFVLHPTVTEYSQGNAPLALKTQPPVALVRPTSLSRGIRAPNEASFARGFDMGQLPRQPRLACLENVPHRDLPPLLLHIGEPQRDRSTQPPASAAPPSEQETGPLCPITGHSEYFSSSL